MHAFWQDLRFGWRALAKKPLLTTTVVFILALGTGASTGIWSAVDVLWLRPVTYPQPDRLFVVWETHRQVPGAWRIASLRSALAWREEVQGLATLAWSHAWRPVLDAEELKVLEGAKVSAGFFRTLGIEPALGRDFTPDDERPGSAPVVILSHGLWQRELGGDPGTLGRLLPLEGAGQRLAARVIGVLPPAVAVEAPFTIEPAEIWMPLAYDPLRVEPGPRYFRVVGRLSPGTAMGEVGERLDAVGRRLAEEHPETHRGWSPATSLAREVILAPRRPALAALQVAVALVFVAAVSNAAMMLLARAITRRREMAVRQALGARPIDLRRQRFLESLLVAGMGAAAGLALARGVVQPGLALGLSSWLGGREWTIDGRALAFASLLVVATAAVLTFLPGRAAGSGLAGDLRAGGSAGPPVGGSSVVVQTAASFVLLVTAALLVQSFNRLSRVSPGFETERVLAVGLTIPSSMRPEKSQVDRVWRLLLERIEAMARVRSAAIVNHLPMLGQSMITRAAPVPESGDEPVRVALNGVSRGYFASLGIPFVTGRGFSAIESCEPGRPVPSGVVLSQSAAKALWPGEEAAGKRLTLEWESRDVQEVLGVVADVRHDALDAAVRPTVYLPFCGVPSRSMTLVLRSSIEPEALVSEVRARIESVDRSLVVKDVRPLAGIVETTVTARRGYTLILSAFAVGALLLAAAGTYGTMTYSVARRRPEMGIRLALGASPEGLVRMVVGEGLRRALAGMVLGLAGALLVSRLVSRLLFGISATDLGTFAGVSAVVLAVALIASYLPARQAAKADPVRILRETL